MINLYVCYEKYRGDTSLYLILMLENAYNIIIDYGVGAPGHGKEVAHGINEAYKKVSVVMENLQLNS